MARNANNAKASPAAGPDRETEPMRVANVTAVVIAPGRLFVHWRLAGDVPAKLVLRVHDVTGRLFDGKNSLRRTDFDVHFSVGSTFVEVDQATTEVVVELASVTAGKRAEAWIPLARSVRAVLPGRGPAPPRQVTWLTMTQTDWDHGREPVETWSPANPLRLPPAARQPRGGSEKIACPGGGKP